MQITNDNRGGINAILAVRSQDVVSVLPTRLMGHVCYEVNLAEKAEIIRIPVLQNGGYRFRETEELAAHGERYSCSVSGKMQRNSKNEQLLSKLRGGSWIVLHRDNKGESYVSGSKFVPLAFTADVDSGSQTADTNHISFTFAALAHQPSLHLMPHAIDWLLVDGRCL